VSILTHCQKNKKIKWADQILPEVYGTTLNRFDKLLLNRGGHLSRFDKLLLNRGGHLSRFDKLLLNRDGHLSRVQVIT
jgi:hypothetical protein